MLLLLIGLRDDRTNATNKRSCLGDPHNVVFLFSE